MAFSESIAIEGLRPAPYNPRAIEDTVLQQLKESIGTLGFIKPIVVRSDGLLVAGHQRTKAAAALGIQRVPGHVLEIKGPADEIRFNQLHNGCELDIFDAVVTVAPGSAGTWSVVKGADAGDHLGKGAAERQEMLRLLAKYGPFSGCVADPAGNVVAGQVYAWCCNQLGVPLHVRYVDAELAGKVKSALGRQYGRYSYRHLPKKTWVQCLAQLNRLEGTAQLKSTLYEKLVLPNIRPGERILDFGAGRGAYVRLLQRQGFDAVGIEFYRKRGFSIDVTSGHRQIDAVLGELERRGRFDVVVCDSVLNSVDSPQAERDVLATVNALCRPGGRIFLSGRPRERVDRIALAESVGDHRRYIEFLDADGFTAIYRHGDWHYQKFHDREAVERLAETYIGPEYRITCSNTASVPKGALTGTSWQVWGRKAAEIERAAQEESLAREFDLPIPSGRYGRSADAIRAFQRAIALESPPSK